MPPPLGDIQTFCSRNLFVAADASSIPAEVRICNTTSIIRLPSQLQVVVRCATANHPRFMYASSYLQMLPSNLDSRHTSCLGSGTMSRQDTSVGSGESCLPRPVHTYSVLGSEVPSTWRQTREGQSHYCLVFSRSLQLTRRKTVLQDRCNLRRLTTYKERLRLRDVGTWQPGYVYSQCCHRPLARSCEWMERTRSRSV